MTAAVVFIDQSLIDASNGDQRRFNKGRPRGPASENPRKSAAWNPKKLTSTHYAILSLRAAGLKQAEIAKEVGKTKEYVSMLCNSEKGKAYLSMMADSIAKKFAEETTERLVKTASQATRNIEAVLEDSTLLELQPFNMFDRSLRFLQAAGRIGADGSGAGGLRSLTAIGDSAIKAISEALIESNGVRDRGQTEDYQDQEIVIEPSESQEDTQRRISSGTQADSTPIKIHENGSSGI